MLQLKLQTLAFALLTAIVIGGQDAQAEVSGAVKAVDAAKGTVTLHGSKTSPEPATFELATDVEVFLDDGTGDKLGFLKGKRTDVTEGTSVILRLSEDQRVLRIWVDGPTVQGTLKAVDAGKNTITAAVAFSKVEPLTDMTFAVSRNAKLFIDDAQPVDKLKKAPTLADLPAGAVVSLKLSADRKVVGGIRAEGVTVAGVLKAVDAAKSTVTVTVSVKGEPDVNKTYTVSKTASVAIDDGKQRDKSKAAVPQILGEIPAGARMTLRLSTDGQSVVFIWASGSDVHGTVKAVDAAKNTITLHDKVVGEKTYSVQPDVAVFLDGKGEARKLVDVPVDSVVDFKLLADQQSTREIRCTGPTVAGSVVGTAGNDSITLRDKEGEKTFAVARDARIQIEDTRVGKLTELIEGTVAQVRLSADKTMALEIRAEGPTFEGIVKTFDVDKKTITLLIGSKGGQGGEDKDFKLSNDTVVVSDNGSVLKLTDLRAPSNVILRLAIDQKAAAKLTILSE